VIFLDPVDSCSSVLHFSLLDVVPEEHRYIKKISGLKFVVRERKLVPTKSVEDLRMVNIYSILNRIPVPEQFNKDAVVYYLNKRFFEFLEREREIKRVVEEIQKAQRRELLSLLITLVSKIKEKIKFAFDNVSVYFAEKFLSSDLPLSFYYNSFSLLETFLAHLSVLEAKLRKHRPKLLSSRAKTDFRYFQKRFKELQRDISLQLELEDKVLEDFFSLFYYVDLWNSSSYEEILEEKPLTMDKLDETVFYKLLSVFTESLREFRRFLLKDKNARFKTSINLRDPYVKAVRKMLLTEVVT